MKFILGKAGLKHSWQDEFPETTRCCGNSAIMTDGRCSGEARIAFVASEDSGNTDPYVCLLHKSEKGKFWPHDAIAVAVYFCPLCGEVTAIYTQA